MRGETDGFERGFMRYLLVGLGLLLWPGTGWAQDERHTMTRQTILDWVERYRDAEPEFQAGDTLTQADSEKLRPFLPPGYVEEFRFPEATFEIVAPGDYAPRQDYLETTEKFAGQTHLAEDGSLLNYVAGQPFASDTLDPADPTSGLKLGWNFNFRWQNYGIKVGNFGTILIAPGGTHAAPSGLPEDVLPASGTVERVLLQRYQRVYHSHLAMRPDDDYTLPIDGAGQFEWKEVTEFTDPYEMRGMRILIQRSNDPHLADQAWTYVPSLRKVRRVSAEEKADSFQGSDTTLDDFFGFSGRVLDYAWTFHGRKGVLHVMNSQYPYARYYGPAGRAPLGRWELRNTLAVEIVPKRANHPYSSKWLFIDAQTYRVTCGLAFDRDGKLWKIWDMQNSWSEDATIHQEMNKGMHVSRYLGVAVIDVRTDQASLFPALDMGYPDVEIEEVLSLYDVNKLTEGRR